MNGKKDMIGWASIGLSVIAIALASISLLALPRTHAFQQEKYREMESRSYVRAVEELEKTMSEIGVRYSKKPSTLNEVLAPMMRDVEDAE